MAQSKTALSRVRLVGRILALVLAAGPGTSEPARSARSAEPIRFARGASSAEVSGAVIRGERALYSVEARGGQRMSLRIVAPENNAVFQVYAPGAESGTGGAAPEIAGDTLPGAGAGDDATRWTGVLPRSGAYLLVVGATRGNASYRLTVTVR